MIEFSEKRKSLVGTSAIFLAAILLLAAVVPSIPLALADPCPATIAGKVAIDASDLAFTESGTTTRTYGVITSNQNPGSPDIIPGIIEVCTFHDGTATEADATYDSWNANIVTSDRVEFTRPNGNPTNIPMDGGSYEVGNITFSTEPTKEVIMAHINWPSKCDELYGGNPGTCFVLLSPGDGGCPEGGCPPPPTVEPPTVSKDAAGSYKNSYTWTITKDVNKTLVKQVGGSATFNYRVNVTHDSGAISNIKVNGTITVNNPNDEEEITGVDVTDKLSDNTVCTVTDGSQVTLQLGDNEFAYSCNLSSLPQGQLNNTATVTWPEQFDFGALAAGSANFTYSSIVFAETKIDECINVSDSYAGSLGTVCVGDANPRTFTYSRTISIPQYGCRSYDNTANFTATDTGATGSAGKTVTVCGPVNTGALTMGFWQNKNGQDIIKGGSSTAGVCNSGTWLRQYAPFQDLSATATCTQVNSYVTNVIKAASASGASMNAMLKAQMLATSLDVYFSDPALGGNRIGAAVPIGGVSIDLTKICKNISTCTIYENTSPAFGGATSLTVSQILSYAASQSNAGGSTWYGNVKSTQELAKDTFDAINNKVAFAP